VSRPADWAPLADRDPIPGDPTRVRAEAQRLGAMADEIAGQVTQLKRIAAAEGLEGDYVQTLTDGSTKLADSLSKVTGRYREVSGALITYVPLLEAAQSESLRIRQRAQEAEAERLKQQSLMNAVVVPPEPQPLPAGADATQKAADDKARQDRTDQLEASGRHRRAMESAEGEIEKARTDLRRVEGQRDDAADAAARRIKQGSDDEVKDSWWDNVKDWIHKNSGWISEVTKILGYVGVAVMVLCLFVPGLNILAAAGLALSVASLAGHTALALSGDGSWADVGLDVLALATFGVGRIAVGGVKAAQAAARSAGAVKAGRVAATEAKAATSAARATAGAAAARGGPGARQAAAELRALQAKMKADMAAARTQARTAYEGADLGRVRPLDRIRAGTDGDLANLVGDARRVAADFPNTAKVTAAVAKVAGPAYNTARLGYGGAALTGMFSATMDATNSAFKPWKSLQDKWTHEVGSPW
jgi:hypothetical protein